MEVKKNERVKIAESSRRQKRRGIFYFFLGIIMMVPALFLASKTDDAVLFPLLISVGVIGCIISVVNLMTSDAWTS